MIFLTGDLKIVEQLTSILKTNIQFYRENAYFLYMECSNWEIWMTLNRDKLDFDSSVIFCLVRFWPILLTFFLQIQFMQNFVRKKKLKNVLLIIRNSIRLKYFTFPVSVGLVSIMTVRDFSCQTILQMSSIVVFVGPIIRQRQA